MNRNFFKLLILAAVANEVNAEAGKPSLSLGFNTEKTKSSPLGGLEPSFSWQSSGAVGDFDLEGGTNMKISDFDEIPPISLWGKVKRTVSGFALSARGDVAVKNPDKVALDLGCVTPMGTKVQVKGIASPDAVQVSTIKLSQFVADVGDGDLIVIPTYNVPKSVADVTLAYGTDKAIVQVDASTTKDAKLTLTYKISKQAEISPSITTDGDVSVDYKTALEKGSMTLTVKPKSFVNVKWSDGPWQANFKAPMDGYSFNDGIKVSVSTKVDIDSPWK